MATTEVVRDQPPTQLAPIDTSVVIPESVRRAAAAADAYYAPKEQVDQPVDAPIVEATPTAPVEPVSGTVPEKPDSVTVTETATEAAARAVGEAPIPPEQWEHRYHSMEGRYKKSLTGIAQLQDTVSQLGDELTRVQTVMQTAPDPSRAAAPAAATKKLLTPEDEQNYGAELIDLAKRAAAEAVGPELDALKHENANLKNRVVATAQQGVVKALDDAVPNWRDINVSPKFKNWLRLRDLYSGGVRQGLLTSAFQAADAPRVVAFFKGFVTDEAAMGSADLAPTPEQPADKPAPRTAAVPLATLTAPGRARPASGEQPSSVDKPIFTRAQIRDFYANVRRGAYAGREVEKDRQEREIFAAQQEGRVR